MTLGDYLHDALHRRGWTPEQFARRSGLGTSHVYHILSGETTDVRHSTLERIARGLGMTLTDLVRAIELPAEDPFERSVRDRVSEMRQALAGIPRAYWSTIIQQTWDHAIDEVRDWSDVLNQASEQPTPEPEPAPEAEPENGERELANNHS